MRLLRPDHPGGIQELLRLIERAAGDGRQALAKQAGHVERPPDIGRHIVKRALRQLDATRAVAVGAVRIKPVAGRTLKKRRLLYAGGVAASPGAALSATADGAVSRGNGDADTFFSVTDNRDWRRAA